MDAVKNFEFPDSLPLPLIGKHGSFGWRITQGPQTSEAFLHPVCASAQDQPQRSLTTTTLVPGANSQKASGQAVGLLEGEGGKAKGEEESG